MEVFANEGGNVKKKTKKWKVFNSEIGFDGDTGECQLIVYLKTKNEKKAHKEADKIINRLNGFSK